VGIFEYSTFVVSYRIGQQSMEKSKFIVLMITFVAAILSIVAINCAGETSLSSSQILAMEKDLYNIVQLEPKIESVKYTYKSGSVLGAEFTFDGTNYRIAFPFNMNNISNYVFEIASDNGKFKFRGGDYGSEQGVSPYTGALDGKIDFCQIEDGKNTQIFNRYTNNNMNQRNTFQKLFNSSLEKSLRFFNQP
jgi:hypothetical protein